jgi:2'-5' RNA ligase
MDDRVGNKSAPANAAQDPATVRAFFALTPDAGVRASLAALGRDIARKSRGRAVSPENAHLTLAFLGDVERSRLPALKDVGDRLPHTGFSVEFDSLGAWKASGVAWIAPAQLPPALLTLHSRLADSLAAAGFEFETRPFRPHVTLARRCLQPLPRARCAAIRWNIEQLVLVGSELLPEGPVYRDLATWTLKPAPYAERGQQT